MKSSSLRIVPSASMTRRFQRVGSIVVCKAGAWPGYRIHWEAPQAGGDVTLTSEPLVNGEAYVCPFGSFREFWITTESGLPTPSGAATSIESLQLRVIDLAQPVVTLNPRRFDGFRSTLIHEQAIGTLAFPNTSTLFTSAVQQADADIEQARRARDIPRGWIAGGASGAVAFTIRMQAALDIAQTYWVELARWTCNASTDSRFTCSFEVGARSTFNSTGTNTYNGPVLLPWPTRGLRVLVDTIAVDLTDFYFYLASRTGPV